MNKEPYSFYKKTSSSDEAEIDLMRLILKTCLHWRLWFIFGFAGLFLGLLYGLFSGKATEKVNTELFESDIKLRIDSINDRADYNAHLNEEDENSYIMSLDDDGEYIEKDFQYLLGADSLENADMASLLFNIKDTGDYLQKLKEITGFNGNINSLGKIIDFTIIAPDNNNNNNIQFYNGETGSFGTSLNKSNPSETDYDLSLTDAPLVISSEGPVDRENPSNEDSADSSIYFYRGIKFRISYLTEEEADEFSSFVEDFISSGSSDLKNSLKHFSFKKINESVIPMSVNSIRSAKQNIRDTVLSRKVESEESFRNLISSLVADKTIDNDKKANYELYWESITDPDYKETINKKVIIKFILMAGIGLGIMGGFLTFVFEFFSLGKINVSTLREEYNLEIIGYCPERKKKKGIDGLLDKMIYPCKEANPKYISSQVSAISKGEVLISLTDEEHVPEGLNQELKATYGNLLTDPDFLAMAKKEGELYILAQLEKTNISTLEEELRKVSETGLRLLGVILV